MQELVLNARRREGRGKGVSHRLRAAGEIPAILYGEGESLSLALNPRELRLLLNTEAGANALLRLRLEGKEDAERMVMVWELQTDPVRGDILHADLLRVSMDKEVEVEVPIELEGEPVGVKQHGGILGQILWSLSVRCLPNAIPTSIQADASGLAIGDVLHVRDLKVPSGVTALTDPEEAVANVTVIAEEVPAAAEAAVAEGEAEGPEAAGAAKEETAEG